MKRTSILEISKSAFMHNINEIKKYTNKEIMPVIKASAYGTYINRNLDLIKDFNIVEERLSAGSPRDSSRENSCASETSLKERAISPAPLAIRLESFGVITILPFFTLTVATKEAPAVRGLVAVMFTRTPATEPSYFPFPRSAITRTSTEEPSLST